MKQKSFWCQTFLVLSRVNIRPSPMPLTANSNTAQNAKKAKLQANIDSIDTEATLNQRTYIVVFHFFIGIQCVAMNLKLRFLKKGKIS